MNMGKGDDNKNLKDKIDRKKLNLFCKHNIIVHIKIKLY